jgi:hypothetical protein
MCLTMSDTPRTYLLILGDAEGLAYVLRQQRMAFTRGRQPIPAAHGDRLPEALLTRALQ